MESHRSTVTGDSSDSKLPQSPSSSSSSSEDEPRPLSSLEEHVDSPLRKKPRLHKASVHQIEMPGSSDNIQDPSSKRLSQHDQESTDLPDSTSSSSSQKPRNKITLNYRPNPNGEQTEQHSSNMTTNSDRPVDLTSTDEDADSSATADAQPTSPMSASSPPVVEIELDDPVDSDDNDNLLQTVNEDHKMADIMMSFPYARARSPAQAARDIASHLEKEMSRCETALYQAIDDWMFNWLGFAGNQKDQWKRMYRDDVAFWHGFSQIILQIVSKRCLFGRHADEYDDARANLIEYFFQHSLEICYQQLFVDHEISCTLGSNVSEISLDCCANNLKILELLFYKCDESPMWVALFNRFRFEVHAVLRVHAEFYLNLHESASCVLNLVAHWFRIGDSNPTASNLVTSGIAGLSGILRNVNGFYLDRIFGYELDHSTAKAAQDLILSMETSLLESVGKKESSTPSEYARKVTEVLSDAIEIIIVTGGESLCSNLKSYLEFPTEAKDVGIAKMIQSDHIFRLCEAFIRRGRMDLRMFGVHYLQVHLIALWKLRFEHEMDLVIRYVVTSIQKRQLIEYVVSVASHAQLIHKSCDMVLFTLYSRGWTESMTKAIFNTIEFSQDPQIILETVRLLATVGENADTPMVFDLCHEINNLPSDTLSPQLLEITFKLFSKVTRIPSEKLEDHPHYESPYVLCKNLLSYSLASPRTPIPASNDPMKVYEKCLFYLEQIAKYGVSPEERIKVYEESIAAIRDGHVYATGSHEVIRAFLKVNIQDLPVLLDQGLARIILTGFCDKFVPNQKALGPSDLTLRAIEARFRILQFLVLYGPSFNIEPDLEQKSWNHLVGPCTIDEICRNQGWMSLSAIFAGCSSPNDFLDRCIRKYLMTTPAEFFTQSAFGPGDHDFITEVMSYEHRVRPQPLKLQGEIVDVTLVDFLWSVVLTAPSIEISKFAAAKICYQHLESPAIKEAPSSAVAEAHKVLVEQCFQKLKQASLDLKTTQELSFQNSGILNNSTGINLQDSPRHSFERVLTCLRQFVLQTRAIPSLRTISPSITSSPKSLHSNEGNENTLTLKYQIFNRGEQTDIRELTISSHQTFADLLRRIEKLTRFVSYSIIQGGLNLNLEDKQTLDIQSVVDKGPILIHNRGEKVRLPKQYSQSVGLTTAEMAVLDHFEELYEFLDLEDSVSRGVFIFLGQFPPHDDFRNKLTSQFPDHKVLFPLDKTFKSLYCVTASRKLLDEQKKSGNVDHLFVSNVASALIKTLTAMEDITIISEKPQRTELLVSSLGMLLTFLKERPHKDSTHAMTFDEAAFVKNMLSILHWIKDEQRLDMMNSCWKIYETLVEVFLHSKEAWDVFIADPNTNDLHLWLLVDIPEVRLRVSVQSLIQTVVHDTIFSGKVSPSEFRNYFWNMIRNNIHRTESMPYQSGQIFELAPKVFSSMDFDESIIRNYLTEWTVLLLNHHNMEGPWNSEPDDFIFGLTRLMIIGVSYLKSFKKPLEMNDLADRLYNHYLFPKSSSLTTASDPPILDSRTRGELYKLILALCDNPEVISRLLNMTLTTYDLAALHETSGRHYDRSHLLRSTTGYSGLRNLTNTCYMNSLMAQLYMNIEFRDFILGIQVIDPHAQSLIVMTQNLFANVQDSQKRFADTEDFAMAIKPYDGPQLDITIQMDVAEFYNLLFDRWEDQMPNKADKDRLKTFYGGQFVQQIKSKDCDHVSERLESFSTLSCEVKGKSGLVESLTSYVQGEVIEGDNKYKCESCNGRMVDAVKRSCLNNLPDRLIIDLKRFEYDLFQGIRSKVDDRFEFPASIDMSPYKIDYLENKHEGYKEDIFELTGVLVHSGFAEAGHYYSFIRIPSASGGRGNEWLEVNDEDVLPFDCSKIPEMCYGGPYEPDPSLGLKRYNAYMLFYERRSSIQNPFRPDSTSLSQFPPRATIPTTIQEKIINENEDLLLKYNVSDSAYTQFILNLSNRLKEVNNGKCSEEHQLETTMISTMMAHLPAITRMKDVPDLEKTLNLLQRLAFSCVDCNASILNFLVNYPQIFLDMILETPLGAVRNGTLQLVSSLLQDLREKSPTHYGADPSEIEVKNHDFLAIEGCFPRIVKVLKDAIPIIGKSFRHWDQFFNLLYQISLLGHYESFHLIIHGFFEECLDILFLDTPDVNVHKRSRQFENQRFVAKSKYTPAFFQVIKVLAQMFEYLNPSSYLSYGTEQRIEAFNSDSVEFPLSWIEDTYLSLRSDNNSLFLSKVMEGWDLEAEPFCTGMIFRRFWNCSSDFEDQQKLLLSTLIRAIREYDMEYIAIPLRTAFSIIDCNPPMNITERLVSAARVSANAKIQQPTASIINNSSSAHCSLSQAGGPAYVEFLFNLCRKQGDHPLNPRPYYEIVLKKLADFAGPLMFNHENQVQQETAKFLDLMLFNHFPKAESPNALDMERVEQVRRVLRYCLGYLMPVNARNMRHQTQALSEVMKMCANWIELIQDRSTQRKLLTAFARPDEDRKLIEKYRAMSAALLAMNEDSTEETVETDIDEAGSDDETSVLTSDFGT